jgi:hypothetical protein
MRRAEERRSAILDQQEAGFAPELGRGMTLAM